jgi:hypothetical protein
VNQSLIAAGRKQDFSESMTFSVGDQMAGSLGLPTTR